MATSLSDPLSEVTQFYGRRFEIEECFRDIKNERNGLCLRGTKLSSTDRYDRLFLVITCGYLFMVVTGHWAEERDLHRPMMANTVPYRTLGLWRVGRNILRRPEKYPFIREIKPEELFEHIREVVRVA
ncbi:hypothetical protein H1S01_16750 [Heliobacterium chlorum]|uniref:Transposase IS4-like domain-containing protein n=1 Tax=Heliobacterium chlorum TaxID=2698 RepID=A0ABR7T5R1_HELCL|nr:hypothetical protein [Heliobacterium chlorum]MBC9786116.1 hypothetical protein [Heliobacterium chlorum]MBC9786119.1 hypothetical protein [Heliobacterium chlorum]